MHGTRLHKTSRRDEMVRDPRRDRDETLVRLETVSRPRPHPWCFMASEISADRLQPGYFFLFALVSKIDLSKKTLSPCTRLHSSWTKPRVKRALKRTGTAPDLHWSKCQKILCFSRITRLHCRTQISASKIVINYRLSDTSTLWEPTSSPIARGDVSSTLW